MADALSSGAMNDTVRFLHTADLHLDSPLQSVAARNPELGSLIQDASRMVLQRIVDTALHEAVDALLIAGDLFDGQIRDVRTAKILERELRRLAVADIPVFIIWGNHDAEAKLTEALQLPSNVHTFGSDGGHVHFANDSAVVHGVSFNKRQAPKSLLPKYSPPLEGCFNIGMLHTSLSGADGHNDYAPCTVKDLIDIGYDYWALGHIHKRTIHHEQPAIVMPGNPLGRHINEAGERTVSLVTLRKGVAATVEAICLAPVRFERINIDLTGLESRNDAFDKMINVIDAVRDRSDVDCLIARIVLCGESRLANHYKRDRDNLLVQLQVEYEQKDGLWIDSIDLHSLSGGFDANGNSATSGNSMLTTLHSMINSDLLADANLRESVSQDLSRLIRALPAELKDIFDRSNDENEQLLLDTLMKDGGSWMIQQIETEDNTELPTQAQQSTTR